MPRRKVSTLLDEHLFRRAKLESLRQRKQLSEILGEALERYLGDSGSRTATTGVVADRGLTSVVVLPRSPTA
jgi:hypothetical protein